MELTIKVSNKFGDYISEEIVGDINHSPSVGDRILVDVSSYTKIHKDGVCIYHEIKEVRWDFYKGEVSIVVLEGDFR